MNSYKNVLFRAPSGCRQFFTGETGTITSFNHVNGAAVGTILGSTNYKACIRMEAGMYFTCIFYTLSPCPKVQKLLLRMVGRRSLKELW